MLLVPRHPRRRKHTRRPSTGKHTGRGRAAVPHGPPHRLPARPPPNLEGDRDLVGPGFRPVEPCAEVVLYRQAEERKPQPTAQPAGKVVSTLPDAVLGRPSGRVIGCAELSDEHSERDADRDREQLGHDDENDEAEHRRGVALSCHRGSEDAHKARTALPDGRASHSGLSVACRAKPVSRRGAGSSELSDPRPRPSRLAAGPGLR